MGPTPEFQKLRFTLLIKTTKRWQWDVLNNRFEEPVSEIVKIKAASLFDLGDDRLKTPHFKNLFAYTA